jgi:hypothetical protein
VIERRFFVLSLMVAVAFFLAALAAVQAPEVQAIQTAEAEPSFQNTMTGTSHLPLVTRPDSVFFFDDFSDPNSGWLDGDDTGSVVYSYQSGEYQIYIRDTLWWGGAAPPLDDIADYSVEAEMRLHSGSKGFYGLIFERLDWNHFYLFAVSPDSQEFVVLRHDPAWVFLVSFTSSSAIKSDSATNHLRVERVGEQIDVYANGQFLASVNDGTYHGSSDEAGLFAQSDSDVPMSVRYDNFRVDRLSASTARPEMLRLTRPDGSASEGSAGFIPER